MSRNVMPSSSAGMRRATRPTTSRHITSFVEPSSRRASTPAFVHAAVTVTYFIFFARCTGSTEMGPLPSALAGGDDECFCTAPAGASGLYSPPSSVVWLAA